SAGRPSRPTTPERAPPGPAGPARRRLSPSHHRPTDSRRTTAMAPSISPLFDLTGRTALVTGGAKGLGLAMARGLAEHGAPTVLADIDDETGRAAAAGPAAATGLAGPPPPQ